MNVDKLKQSMRSLSSALNRLDEALQEDPTSNPFVVDATMQRFEFCLELFWKTMKRLLAYEGIEATSPRETLKHAYQQHWLQDQEAWLDMLLDRNRTSHVYDEQMAWEIYERIKANHVELDRTFNFLKNRYAEVL